MQGSPLLFIIYINNIIQICPDECNIKVFTDYISFVLHSNTNTDNSKELLGVQNSSVLFFVKFNLYSKTNKKILISEIFPVCINDLVPSFR